MSSKGERRKQEKRAKQKKKRNAASVRRTRQSARLAPKSLAEVTGWPVGECFVSENWYEHGPYVHAIFTRRASDGALAGAVFEVDLAERGLVVAKPLSGLTDGMLQSELVTRSQEHAMVSHDGPLVAKLVEVATAMTEEAGGRLPRSLAAAREIFGDVSADDCPHDLKTGAPPPPPPARRPGIIARALDKLFGG